MSVSDFRARLSSDLYCSDAAGHPLICRLCRARPARTLFRRRRTLFRVGDWGPIGGETLWELPLVRKVGLCSRSRTRTRIYWHSCGI